MTDARAQTVAACDAVHLPRRALLAAAVGLWLPPGLAQAAPARLAFKVYRNGAHIGEHRMVFTGTDDAPVVTTDVNMVVKVGPVPVFRYTHRAVERWTGGRWAGLETTTSSNGKIQKVSARPTPGGVQIDGPAGLVRGPADAAPLTHWNTAAFTRPLFNPQEGKMLKVRCTQAGRGHWQIRGEAEIDNWYDETGAWTALKGKLQDGSKVEYRRI